jgi:hypothetical protein
MADTKDIGKTVFINEVRDVEGERVATVSTGIIVAVADTKQDWAKDREIVSVYVLPADGTAAYVVEADKGQAEKADDGSTVWPYGTWSENYDGPSSAAVAPSEPAPAPVPAPPVSDVPTSLPPSETPAGIPGTPAAPAV